MSKAGLAHILELLPEEYQEQAILTCLSGMLANGRWGDVDVILDGICNLDGHSSFKGKALGIGVKCAIRSRNFALAMARLDMLAAYGNAPDILNARADALLQIAIQYLPDNPTPILQLWEPLICPNMRPDTQNTVGHIGFLLVSAFEKNGDTTNSRKIMRNMRNNLAAQIVDNLAKLLMGCPQGKM